MKFVVLGGAGAMGRITVKDLVEYSTSSDHIVIADFDLGRASELAASFKNPHVTSSQVDCRNHSQLVNALKGAFCVINSVQYQMNLEVMEAALEAHCHYIDLGGLFHVTRKQLELHHRFRRSGLLALIGMGAAPGITNILTKMAADEFDTVQEIHTRVAGVDRSKYKDLPALPVSYSLQTILEEFSLEPAVFTRGQFTFAVPMSGNIPMKFPSPVGVKRPMHTLHSEVATLPLSFADKGVQECTFKIAFDTEFLDRVKFLRDLGLASHEPIEIAGVKVQPIQVANKVAMSQQPGKLVGPLKQHEIVRAVVKGTKKGKKLTTILDCHTEGISKWKMGTDVNTGCPPSVAALMMAQQEIQGFGVLPPEVCVPPKAFFKHLQKRKMWVTQDQKAGWSLSC